MSTGMKLNQERLKQQMAVSKAIDDAAAKEKSKVFEIVTTRDPNQPNKPSEKGGYKRRQKGKRSTKRRRRSTKKRRRTMRR
jgi:hypothetical protein